MKPNFTLLAACTLFVLLHSASHAQTAYVMPPDEIGAFQGQFQMQDGTTLTIARRSRKLFAEVAGGSEVELIPTARDSFVSANGEVVLKFQQAGNGNVYGVEMRRPAAAPAKA